MRPRENIKNIIKNFNIDVNPDRDRQILNDLKHAQTASKHTNPASPKIDLRRFIMKNKMTKLAIAAVIVAVICSGVPLFDRISTAKVFAMAIESIKEANTFSCIESLSNGKIVEKIMFKGPDLMRHELLAGVHFIGETTIINYTQRKALIIQPSTQKAILCDKSSEYGINDNTGKLELTRLDTSTRDWLLDLTTQAVSDLGKEAVDGKEVRKLQSKTDKQITTVWVDPVSNLPVQIEINRKGRIIKFTSIKIDTPLDDELFSLDPPSGYQFIQESTGWSDKQSRISAKMAYLFVKCMEFAATNDDKYPVKLTELESVGLKPEILDIVLSASETPGSDDIIKYIQPQQGDYSSGQIVMYAKHDKWPDEGVVVCFADGHREIINNKQLFKELVK